MQVGEAAEGAVCDEADPVASHVQLLEQAEAGEAGLLQPGQMVGGQVAGKAEGRRRVGDIVMDKRSCMTPPPRTLSIKTGPQNLLPW